MFISSRQLLTQTSKYRGYNIGQRMIEDFLARSGIGRCSEFRDTAEAVSKVGEYALGPRTSSYKCIMIGGIQDVSQYYTHSDKLVKR